MPQYSHGGPKMTWIWIAACSEPRTPVLRTTAHPALSSVPTPPVSPNRATLEAAANGVVGCTESVDVTLGPYEGECPGCSFAFTVSATPTLHESGPGFSCDAWSTGWADDPLQSEVNLRVAHAETWVDPLGEMFPNALLRGYDVVDGYGGILLENVWEVWTSDAPSPAPVLIPDRWSFDGTTLAVTKNSTSTHLDLPVGGGWCSDSDAWGIDHGPVPSGITGSGEVACDGFATDRWAFEAADGDLIDVSIDVPDPTLAFDPVLGVLHDGCYYHLTDDVFDCTASVLPYGCPGSQFVARGSGTWEVEVRAAGASCVGSAGGYTISVAGPNGALPTNPLDDDAVADFPLIKYTSSQTLDLVLPAP